jgi:hypothetical protein
MAAAAVCFFAASGVPAMCAAILITGGWRTFARCVSAFWGGLCVFHFSSSFISRVEFYFLQAASSTFALLSPLVKHDIVGQPIALSETPYEIIGVLPQNFHFAPMENAEFWTTIDPSSGCLTRRSCHSAVAAIVIGAGCAILAASLMRKLLFGTPSWDITTLVCVAVVLGASALLASFLPARRAASVDPISALRAE